MSTPALVERFFRHEYGRLVSSLVGRVGGRHLAAIEDAVQGVLLAALRQWPGTGRPENSTAWLYRVAYNNLISDLRRSAGRRELLALHQGELEPAAENAPAPPTEGEIRDELLNMLFLCCDEAIPADSKLVLALKVLCGFDIREIAIRLFSSEAGIYKRLERARARLQAMPFGVCELSPQGYAARLSEVHRILYTLFTEGYLSARDDEAIRRELCEEAMRLTTLLAAHPVGQTPDTFALLALMHLHSARATARQDPSGGLLLLEEQDRTRWDRRGIALGLSWLARSADGEKFSRYHAEAGIAAEHCRAPTFAQTRWDRVVECYELLEQFEVSALHRLNRAVAVAEWRGPACGLAVLSGFIPPSWLAGTYQWAAVLADLHRRCGGLAQAASHRDNALKLAPSAAIAALLRRRLAF